MEASTKKRKREDEPPRITVSAPHKTFERLLKETSLPNLRNNIAKKLGFDEEASFELVQSRDGRTIDLEDDDDFDAFRSYAYSNGSAEVKVRVGGQARTVAFTSQPEIIPSPITAISSPKKKKKKKRSQTPENNSSPIPSANTTSETTTSPSASENSKSRTTKSVAEKAKVVSPTPSEAGPSKSNVTPDAAGRDEPKSDKQQAAPIPSSRSSTEAITPKAKKGKACEGEKAAEPPTTVKTRTKQKEVETSENSLGAAKETSTEQTTATPLPEPQVKKKKKKKQAVEAEQVESSTVATFSPTEQPDGTPSTETTVPPPKGARKKAKKKEKATLTSATNERPNESIENDAAEKEATIKNPRKQQISVDSEPVSSSVSDSVTRLNTDAPILASTSQQPPHDLSESQKPVKKRKKLADTTQQDLSITEPTSVSENISVETKKKRKVSVITALQEVQDHGEGALPSEPPRKKSKRSSSTAGVATDDALDDIINDILKNRSLSATVHSQLQSTPQISAPTPPTPVIKQNAPVDLQAKGKEAGMGSKAKAGKNRKKEVNDTDKSVASFSTAKEAAAGITPPVAAKPAKKGKRVSEVKKMVDQPISLDMDMQKLAEQASGSMTINHQPASRGSLTPLFSQKKEVGPKPPLTTIPVEPKQQSISLGMLPFAPSGSSLSEVLVEGKDEGSSSESEDEFHDSNSSDSNEKSTPPPTKAEKTQQTPANTVIENLLLESLLKPNTPRSWRDIPSSPEDDSEDEKVSMVPDEEDEDSYKRERKKRRSSAFVRRASSTPPVDDDEEEEEIDANEVESEPPQEVADKEAPTGGEHLREETVIEPLRDHIADQESLTHSNADSGYGSTSLKQPDGIEAGPLLCGSQRSITESELNLSFKAINDRGESVVSEGRKSQDDVSIISDGAQVFTMTKEEMISRTPRSGTSSPDPIGLMIDDDPIENNESGIESTCSRRPSSGGNDRQASVTDEDERSASLAKFDGRREPLSEDLAFIYPDSQEDVLREERSDHNKKDSTEKEPQNYLNGLLNVAGRSFTPPPIATLAPGTPGTLKRMKNRYGKLPDTIDTSKGTVIIPASSQVGSGNTAESVLGDTTEGEDHIDQLLSSSVPRGHEPVKATAINTVIKQRKTLERRSEGKSEDLPIGSRLRKRRQTMQVETTVTAMPPPAKPRKNARPRVAKNTKAEIPPNLPHTEVISEVHDLATANPRPIPNAVADADAPKPSTRAEGVSSSLSEVENALEVTSDRDSTSLPNKPSPVDRNDDARERAESPESQASESDEGEMAATKERDFAPRPSFSSFQSLQKIINQPNLFSPATSQPSFLLKPVKSFENIALPVSQTVRREDVDDDDDDSSSESDSDSDGQSVIPKEKRAGNKSTKSRGALDAIRSYVGLG